MYPGSESPSLLISGLLLSMGVWAVDEKEKRRLWQNEDKTSFR